MRSRDLLDTWQILYRAIVIPPKLGVVVQDHVQQRIVDLLVRAIRNVAPMCVAGPYPMAMLLAFMRLSYSR
jgi:hypothetical protein